MDNSMIYQIASLKQMMELVYKNNVEHGWFDSDRSFGDDIALLHSEVSEAYEAFRINGDTADQTVYEDPMAPAYLSKPEGVGSELADVFIRVLDTCKRHNIDLAFEFMRKMEYNRTRPYKHGKTI